MIEGRPVHRLAIVNRGEAAMRCVRAVKALRALEGGDLACIALYTDVDRDAPFVRHADRALRLDAPSGPVSAYLDYEGLIDALVRAGADSVWPGWGFVAEQPDFADRVRAAGLAFLGPSGDVMRELGNKIGAKLRAEASGVPVLPWSGQAVGDAETAGQAALELGFPLLIKAAAGGGGRGIRIVNRAEDVAPAFDSASAEARSAFGDPTLFLERKLDGGRHVEVQIAADTRGSLLALGARDCSVQRRHQKVLEEAPPPGLDAALLQRMYDASTRLAGDVGYVGVGTVEFLLRGEEFYFLEVNPRLQVEHGLTEELTGVDLVQTQIRIARGESLEKGARPAHSSARAAIEARVCAEDPQADFLPAPGRIVVFEPSLGPGIRVDTGVASGVDVPSAFDSLIAKVIATGASREEARARLVAALSDFELVVEGGATNKGYLIELLDADDYRAGRIDTGWLDRTPELRAAPQTWACEALVAAAILSYQRQRDTARRHFFADPAHLSPSRIPPSTGQRADLSAGGHDYRLDVYAVGAWRYRVHLDGRVLDVAFRPDGPNAGTLEIAGRRLRVLHDVSDQALRVEVEGRPHRFASGSVGQVRAGTPATVLAVSIKPGDAVEAGQAIGLLEAMKMEAAFSAPVTGEVREVYVHPGQQVGAGELLVLIDPAGGETVQAGVRLQLEVAADPLDLYFAPESSAPDSARVDLVAADRAPTEARRAGAAAMREEVRRILTGYDLNPERVRRLVAILEAPLPEGDDKLAEDTRWAMAELRHDLSVFADVEQLFIRSPRASVGADLAGSNHSLLRRYVRRMRAAGTGLDASFLDLLRSALSHYGADGLDYTDGLERAVLRMLASQVAPDARHGLVLAIVKRVEALANSGIHLSDDGALESALRVIAGMRGLVSDALADAAVDSRYAIFERPAIEAETQRTTKEVEAWLAAAESTPAPPPGDVLLHLAEAPPPVFERVRRWLDDGNPRRRSLAVVAQMRRLYAPCLPQSHTSAELRGVGVERIDLADGRVLVGSVARPGGIERTLDSLARSAAAAAIPSGSGRSHSIELIVRAASAADLHAVVDEIEPSLQRELSAEQLTLTFLPEDGAAVHRTWARRAEGGPMQERIDCCGLHPETAARIELSRLAEFELERIEAGEDVHCFHLQSRAGVGDERIFVLADVRGRSPEGGADASLHVPAFERAFFEATRTLRRVLGRGDPRRRLQWNRIALFVAPPVFLDPDIVENLSKRLAPATRHLGLEKVVVRLRILDRENPDDPAREMEIVIADPTGSRMEVEWRRPHRDLLAPARDYERRVVAARRRGLVYPYEIIRMLTGEGRGGADAAGFVAGGERTVLPQAHFEEYDLDDSRSETVLRSVAGRPYGNNSCSVVFGVIASRTDKVPDGMRRVLVLSDPTRGMGSLGPPECQRLVAAIDLAERLGIPVEWVPVSSGARIAMDSGTENLDATAHVVRRIVEFTQAGGVIHVVVHGVNVGAQSYFDALATMLQHTRGALIMTPAASMVLTGRAALEASGSVSAEDETAIGGFERVMGPNGQAQYYARDLVDAYRILYEHYRFTYTVPGEAGPRSFQSQDSATRSINDFATEVGEGHDFDCVGGIFDPETNRERKRPFSMRSVMSAVIDSDGGSLERWRSWAGAETAIVWDAHLGGRPVCLVGIESRNLQREGHLPTDGPGEWTGGTLFPLSSKKVARALNSASGNRPVVVLANLSGFDGSPESMRKLQLEYGAEIARAVVNFRGPILFTVVSRYHGGAYVVFSRALNDDLRASALEGSFASVIGGAPAAAVVFTREVRARAAADPRIEAMRAHGGEASEAFEVLWREVLLEQQAGLAADFDAVHSVERAREVGSVERIIAPSALRPYLIESLRGTD